MKKKHIIIVLCCALFILLIFGIVLGSFDFTTSKKLGKTNFYLVENATNIFGLYYQYQDTKDMYAGVLNICVKDVYWDEQYILVSSCHTQSDEIQEYYIVKMLPTVEKGVPWKKLGPLSEEEYEYKKEALNLREKDMRHINIFN